MSRKFRRTKVRQQYGAAPYRIGPDGRLEVMLVTTRETRRWMVPKGWPIKRLGPMGTALREAFEEAGVRGEGGPSIGAFDYLKIMRKGANQICEVEVFPLRVSEELDDLPERTERQRRWFSAEEASRAVGEERLRVILSEMPERVGLRG